MKFPLLRKTLSDARWLMLACSLTLFGLAWIRVIVVASMERYQLQRIARNLPDMIKRLSPVPIEELISYPGLVGFTFEEPMAYLIMAVWAISRGSDSVSGELGRGTMEMLLAQPIGRTRYLATHTLVTLLGVAILASSAYAGTHVGLENTSIKQKVPKRWSIPILQPQRKDEEPEYRYIPLTKFTQPRHYRASALNFACLGIFLVGITMGVSACDRYRWRTIGIVVAFYVLQTVIELTGMSVEGGRWMLNFTFFAAYEPVAFATLSSQDPSAVWNLFASESHGRIPDLGPVGCDLVLVGLGLVGYVSAFVVFRRRDLPAPL